MSRRATLPPDIRLIVYKIYLADYFDAPGICNLPARRIPDSLSWDRVSYTSMWHNIRQAVVEVPVPPPMLAEPGEMRSHLLKWLAREKGIWPDEGAPALKFPSRDYLPEHDFLYLSPDQLPTFSRLLSSLEQLEPISDLRGSCRFRISHWRRRLHVETKVEGFSCTKIRRIALAAWMRHTEDFFSFLKGLENLRDLQELAFIFVESEHGKLEVVAPRPGTNHAAYSIERLNDSDIAHFRQAIINSIAQLETTVRPKLPWPHTKTLKITACKMIPPT
ncbi:hypothetical protein diail_5521 [Diaporthe ilicicola]|nr:hypothetical protein diail_5521 [Diaporthe ilicicola]